MKRTFILLFFFMSFCVFAQESSKEIAKEKIKSSSVETILTPKENDSNNPILERTALPLNQKVAPAIFYVKNDKPIEESAFLKDKDRINTSGNK